MLNVNNVGTGFEIGHCYPQLVPDLVPSLPFLQNTFSTIADAQQYC